MKYTNDYWEQIRKLKNEIIHADAVLMGAGAGLSTSAGLEYSGKKFYDNFSDYEGKYGLHDMYSAGFYPYDTLEEYWAYWSRHVYLNRYQFEVGKPYLDLLKLVQDKDYFVITTNVDHCFLKAGFDKHKLFYTQGDYGLWQCSKPCCSETYNNEAEILKMVKQQKNMKIPTFLIPYCPHCGSPMTMNLRIDDTFVEDKGWHTASSRYADFINRHKNKHILYLELGVGYNTPVIIKYPFWKMTFQNRKAVYACINYQESYCPPEIKKQTLCIQEDIGKVIMDLLSEENCI
ncbi:SIR2 family NAD-dependent protein deacylase [Clostridium neonatale]|uniref:SIR2 family NAD-dependent protein deacylase n=1 Tax=Clostridium neonatale TaxID=137838 RepID=UPI001E45AB65|nr:Sir2 family NAD-dependent protein deacetylase [Clostridium neonatale]